MGSHKEYDRLRARFDELKAGRTTTEDTWQQISDNLLGRRDFTVKRTPGEQRLQRIYADAAKVSSSLLSGAMHSLLTSPQGFWFDLRLEDPRLQDLPGVAEWVDLVVTRMRAALTAPAANFHAQLAETYIDLINFGTGAIFIDDVPGVGVQFSARPLQELFLAEDPSGRIDTIGRMYDLTARQAVKMWGDVAVEAKKALDSGHSEDKAQYVHLIVPREDVVVGNMDVSGMPWASFDLTMDSDRTILREGGYHEMPLPTPRWEKDAGEVYGRGPGWNALSTQKMLNEITKSTIIASQLAIAPVRMFDSEAVLPGDLNFRPHGVIAINNVMASMDPPVQTLPSGTDFRVSEQLISDTKKSVQDAFHHQLIEVIQDPRMTATQVLELSAQMQRHLAPILGRMQTEMLDPILDRVYAIEVRAGRMPPPPEEISGKPLKFDYVSPVARAQQAEEARAFVEFSGFAMQLQQADPDVAHVVDYVEGIRKFGEALGIPAVVIRDKKQVEQRKAAARQVAAEEAEMQQAVTATDQIAKLAKAMPQQQQGA